MMKRTISSLCIAALFGALLFEPAMARMYKWVDEDGQVHYSQQPPMDKKSEHIKATPPPRSSGKSADKDTKEADAEQATAEEDETKQYKVETEASIKRNCKQARDKLTSFTMRGRVQVNEGGTYRTLTEEERQAGIAEAKKRIKQYCE